jgi:Asp-tRNA(Asn)/Glu-tRNA(Gln) amidotransferase A subunit family amidase
MGDSNQHLAHMSAIEAVAGIRAGAFTSEAMVRSCLDRCEAVEETVQAWAFLDPDYALEQARKADAAHASAIDLGPLHGVPVGLKDIIDTKDMPTEYGTVLRAGRRPREDATVVSLLRQAGAVIMGKTVSTELAAYHPGKTRNPHDPERTPGGSSSGSTAAVAAGMVPLSVGTQTNGSVIRPAAYCGVYGLKPTHAAISRHGVLRQSQFLDHVGVFARCVEDLALLAEPLMAYDAGDADMRPQAARNIVAVASQDPPATPIVAFVKTPVWDEASEDTKAAFAELASLLGDSCDEVDLPPPFENVVQWHRTVMFADIAKNYATFYDNGRDQLSDNLRAMIEEGQGVLAVDYNQAIERREVLNSGLAEVFRRYDAVLTPAAPSEAPLGLDSTGNPIFSTLWTFCGTPAVTLPLLRGAAGLPMGVQLVAARGDEGRLLRTARWLVQTVENA